MTAARPDQRRRFRYRHPRLPFTIVPAPWLRKDDCPGCVAARDGDSCARWPVGWCGPDCLRRLQRIGGN